MRREVKIGIFAVLMIGALWAGIRFLKGFDIFSRNAVYYAAYDQVDGVQNASPILIRGVKVGAVTDISFDPSIGNEVVLQLTIQRKYRIPSNSEARIYSNSIMGAKAIEIALGDAGTYLQSGGHPLFEPQQGPDGYGGFGTRIFQAEDVAGRGGFEPHDG